MFDTMMRPAAMAAGLSLLVLAGCGGGGGGDTAPVTPVTPTGGGTPTATLVTPATGKTTWQRATAASVSLKDGSGATVSGALSCSAVDSTQLSVAADCSSLTGLRLGTQKITVSGGGVSAVASVKVIPPAVAIGTHGVTSSNGSGDYNLVVTPTGQLLAWGANPGGVLGQGQTQAQLSNLSLPTAVKDAAGSGTLGNVVAASAGNTTALALTEDGEVYAWGDNGSDQLGINQVVSGVTLPTKVVSATGSGSLQHVVSVSVGASNALALVDDGTVYVWGTYTGQGSSRAKVPTLALGVGGTGTLSGAVAVSAGWNWSAVLLANGQVVTWGFGSDGQQGHGSAYTSSAPQPQYLVNKATGLPLTGITSMSAGYNFGVAAGAGGITYAWGDNHWGQLGQGTLLGNIPAAVPVLAALNGAPLTGLRQVVAGGNHALAVDSTGTVLSWGYSQKGQLGDGPNHPRLNASAVPAPVLGVSGLVSLTGVSQLVAGYAHSLALLPDGSLLAWGAGFQGDLGQGAGQTTDSYLPLVVLAPSGTGNLYLSPVSYYGL